MADACGYIHIFGIVTTHKIIIFLTEMETEKFIFYMPVTMPHIIMMKQLKVCIYGVVCDCLCCLFLLHFLFLLFFINLLSIYTTFTMNTFVTLALFYILFHHFIFISCLFPSISDIRCNVLNSFQAISYYFASFLFLSFFISGPFPGIFQYFWNKIYCL